MIYSFGKKSSAQLETCDIRLRIIARQSLSMGLIDFAIIEGYRTDAKQHEYFVNNKSKVDVGNMKAMHNFYKPAKAFDAVPWVNHKLSWNPKHCIFLAGVILTVAKWQGTPVRWGGNWDMDGEPITDQDFQDLVHYEIKEVV